MKETDVCAHFAIPKYNASRQVMQALQSYVVYKFPPCGVGGIPEESRCGIVLHRAVELDKTSFSGYSGRIANTVWICLRMLNQIPVDTVLCLWYILIQEIFKTNKQQTKLTQTLQFKREGEWTLSSQRFGRLAVGS